MPNWRNILDEIGTVRANCEASARAANDFVRRQYLQKLHEYSERNVIAYYSGWLSKQNVSGVEINDEDKNGFMMAVHGIDKSLGLDLMLHTPGGDIASTQSLVDYLQKMFGTNIRAIVPQIAMSAGTMLACSCREIIMGKHSNLGPIDPHLRGIPAAGVKREFDRACKEVQNDPSKLGIWSQVIRQYRPTFLSQCENAITWSNAFVRDQLTAVMFEGQRGAKKKARSIVRKLASFSGNKTHARHIYLEECDTIGLNVVQLEDDEQMQDLVLTVHHCYMHTLMNTTAYKIIENQMGNAMVKTISVVQR